MAGILIPLIFATIIVNFHAALGLHCLDGCVCSSETLVCLNNNITSIPRNSSLQQIIVLNVSSNQIQTLEEKVFFKNNLMLVEVIDLSYNLIYEIHENAFYGLDNLKELYFQGNKLEEIYSQTFSPVTQLTILDLSNNNIRNFEDKTFEPVTLLKILSVSGLREFNENVFDPLKNLIQLQIEFVSKGNYSCKKQISKVMYWGKKNNIIPEATCGKYVDDDDSQPFSIFSYNIPLHPSLENTITHGEFIMGIVITVGVLLLLIISLVILAIIVRQTEKISEELDDSYMSDFEPYRGQLSPTNTKECYWPSSCDDIPIIIQENSVAPREDPVSNGIPETMKVPKEFK